MRDKWKYITGFILIAFPIWMVFAIFIKTNPPSYEYEVGDKVIISDDMEFFLDEDPNVKKVVWLKSQRFGIVQWQQHYGINGENVIVKRYQLGKNRISGLVYSE
jgi:hypothetical protein